MSSWAEIPNQSDACAGSAAIVGGAARRTGAPTGSGCTAEKARALAKIDAVLELGMTLAVRGPAHVEPRRLQEATSTLSKLSAASGEAAQDVSAVFPAEAATLSRIQLTCDRLTSIASYDIRDILDRAWLCRQYRDLYGRLRDLALVAAERDGMTGSPRSHAESLQDDPYIRPMFERTFAFGIHLVGEEGCEAIRVEVSTGRRSRYAHLDD